MAIRSNSKAAKSRIRNYIDECLRTRIDELTEFDGNEGDFNSLCKAYTEYLDDIFRNDYVLKSTALRIAHDLDGGGQWEIGTWERALLIGEWLEETEEELDRYYERGTVDDMFHHLIIREVMQAARRYA